MKLRIIPLCLLVAVFFAITSFTPISRNRLAEHHFSRDKVISQAASSGEPQSQNVEKFIEAYFDAVNRRDISEISRFLDLRQVYKKPITGLLVEGNEQMKSEYEALFKHLQNATLKYSVDDTVEIGELTIVDGTLNISRPKMVDSQTSYKIFLTRKNGEWKIQDVGMLNIGQRKVPNDK